MEPFTHDQQLASTRDFVTQFMSRFDPSHDIFHIMRVVGIAKRIHDSVTCWARPWDRDASTRETVILLAAMLHDVGDAKYELMLDGKSQESVLQLHLQRYPWRDAVINIVKNVGYSHMIADASVVSAANEDGYTAGADDPITPLDVVRDADIIDASGAVGIARFLTFGSSRNRAIVIPSVLDIGLPADTDEPKGGILAYEVYKQRCREARESMSHVADKLLIMHRFVRTPKGRSMIDERQPRMAQYVRDALNEAQEAYAAAECVFDKKCMECLEAGIKSINLNGKK